MGAKAMIKRTLKRATPRVATPSPATADQGTPLPSGTPTLGDLAPWERELLAAAVPPVPVADAAEVAIFRSMLLRREIQGQALRAAFDRLLVVHPQVAAAVVDAGALGAVMWARAVDALETYRRTGVAAVPVTPRSL